mmetsp:Transcript_16691/g.30793  ORF Transcript_16691/g.30793 Transcript_16691/m.30793 type:complete len:101 (+) Transcript_16691:603-905(+)
MQGVSETCPCLMNRKFCSSSVSSRRCHHVCTLLLSPNHFQTSMSCHEKARFAPKGEHPHCFRISRNWNEEALSIRPSPARVGRLLQLCRNLSDHIDTRIH